MAGIIKGSVRISEPGIVGVNFTSTSLIFLPASSKIVNGEIKAVVVVSTKDFSPSCLSRLTLSLSKISLLTSSIVLPPPLAAVLFALISASLSAVAFRAASCAALSSAAILASLAFLDASALCAAACDDSPGCLPPPPPVRLASEILPEGSLTGVNPDVSGIGFLCSSSNLLSFLAVSRSLSVVGSPLITEPIPPTISRTFSLIFSIIPTILSFY